MKKPDRTTSFFVRGIMALWSLLGREKRRVVYILIITLIVQTTGLATPYVLKLVFDELPKIIEKGFNDYFILLLVIAGFVPLISHFLHHIVKEPMFIKNIIYLENWWPVIAQKQLLALSQGYHERENTGKKIAKINKGCEKMVGVMMKLFWGIIPQTFYLLVNVIIITFLDWRLAIIFFVPFLPVAIIIKKIFDKKVPDWDKWSSKNEVSGGLFCQSVVNIGAVQGFVQESKEKKTMKSVRKEMSDIDLDIHLDLERKFFWLGVVLHSALMSAILYGIWLAIQGEVGIGTVVYTVSTGSTSMYFLQEIIELYSQVMKDLVSVVRMKDLLDKDEYIENKKNAIFPKDFGYHLWFKDIAFRYKGKNNPVLDKFNLEIKPNEMVALVGKSGSGKTTVIKLLSRIYDVTKGSIKLDGVDIRNIDRNWYRRLFATVQQDVDIFDASLRDNIAYAQNNASEEDVLRSLKAAHLNVVIEDSGRFPDGLDTQVGERGVRLSGGERQRLGIARAFLSVLKDAKVLILDEATSSLDSEAERAIQNMINDLRKHKQIVVVAIAHRLSTIQQADKICVLEAGCVIEEGDHNRLLAQNGLYSRLVKLQQLGELRKD